MSHFQTIGIVVKTDAQAVQRISARVMDDLRARGLHPVLDEASGAYLKCDAPVIPSEALGTHCDLVIALGGDGTLLKAGRALARAGVPVLGVNLGRLGFMVDIAPDEVSASLNRILDGEYSIEERLILEATIEGSAREPDIAINDVVVRHRRFVRMLDFATYANGTFISQHRADGIILSTPTGSTAYALSSGGPMMHPALEAIALVPICPHTLSDRPLILEAGSQIAIETSSDPDNVAFYTCDGQSDIALEPGARLLVSRSPHRLRLVHPPDYDYFGILRNKLNWGRNRT